MSCVGRFALSLGMVALVVAAGGCGGGDPSTTNEQRAFDPAAGDVEPEPAGTPIPAVRPERCEPDIPPSLLAVPNQDAVERTDWKLVRVGSCPIGDDYARDDVSFMDGWAGLPADHCGNTSTGKFTARGRRFVIDPNMTATTMAGCEADALAGYLGSVTSWGIGDNDHIYLLDRNGMAIFVARPSGPPGCVIDVPPNGRKLVANGEDGCTTSDMDNDLRD